MGEQAFSIKRVLARCSILVKAKIVPLVQTRTAWLCARLVLPARKDHGSSDEAGLFRRLYLMEGLN